MIAWFAHHPTAANLLMAAIMILGIVALPGLQRETFPEIENDKVGEMFECKRNSLPAAIGGINIEPFILEAARQASRYRRIVVDHEDSFHHCFLACDVARLILHHVGLRL